MPTPWSRTLCPFCFEEFHLSDAPWRPLANVDPAPDEHVRRFFDLDAPPVLPRTLPPETGGWARLKRRFVLDNSRIRDHDRVCPACHMPLPQAIATGEIESKVIAVIGERWSGKSAFIGVLVHLLTNGTLARDAGFGVVSQTTWDLTTREKVTSSALYHERYGRDLFGETRQVMPATRGLRDNAPLRSPLIYRLMFYKRDRDGRVARPAKITSATDLVLFDTAGEDIENQHTMTLTMRYLTRAAGIIFLVNPLRLAGVRNQLSGATRARMMAAEREHVSVSADVLDTFLNLFDRDHRYGATRTIDVPVSIALTKFDMLRELIDPGSRLLSSPSHVNGFDLDDAAAVSAEVREYLDRWGGGAVGPNLARFTYAG
jgi:hypothetical protein